MLHVRVHVTGWRAGAAPVRGAGVGWEEKRERKKKRRREEMDKEGGDVRGG